MSRWSFTTPGAGALALSVLMATQPLKPKTASRTTATHESRRREVITSRRYPPVENAVKVTGRESAGQYAVGRGTRR
jgi:hypothetical protein